MTTTVCLSFDFDALSSWITSFRQTTPTPMSRGEYGATVGIPRILELLHRLNVPATFFVPGHSAETFPIETRRILDAGHEIAAHGYSHKSPVLMTGDEEIKDFDRAEAALLKVCGVRPIGYRSPAWDLSSKTLSTLVDRGYQYGSNLMSGDFELFEPRNGDWVDDNMVQHWGSIIPLVEFPVAWELDDFVYFQFMGKSLSGLRSTNEVGDIWASEFDYCARFVRDGVFTLTMHPEVIGRGPRIRMLEQLIEKMRSYPDVRFCRMADAAASWRSTPRGQEGAKF